jgi:hypothetical protein
MSKTGIKQNYSKLVYLYRKIYGSKLICDNKL